MPTVTIQQAFALALQHHQAGRLADAEALYRQIATAYPDHAGARHHLGVIAHQLGRQDLAAEWIRYALTLDPNDSAAHSNLGEVYQSMGRLDEAIACFRRALQLTPDYPAAHYNLGNALGRRGQSAEAIAAFRRALELQPDYAEAHNNLGRALAGQGQFDAAITAYRRAVQFQPDQPTIHNNLGIALKERGLFEDAMAAYRRALALKPDYSPAHYNLGNALRECGWFDEAITAYRRALALSPDLPEAHNNLGLALSGSGQIDEAMTAYRHALRLKSDYPEAHLNLGDALKDLGRLNEALVHYRRALEHKPDFVEAHNNLGNGLKAGGQLDDAIAAYRQALALRPDFAEAHNNLGTALAARGEVEEAMAAYRRATQLKPEFLAAQSNLLYALHFLPGCDPRIIAEEHDRWNRQFAEPLRKLHRPYSNDRNPERRLRIGYVSPDFKRHPVCYFFLPLLEAHDRARFEICCYASVARPDQYTERVKKAAPVWCDVLPLSDHALAERIRADQIDILVDLTQHLANNRLLMFARKPAPVQVSWLGYPATTGLSAIEYRFTDRFLEPDDSASSAPIETPNCSGALRAPEAGPDSLAPLETPIRLPDSWFCYDPIEDLPVAPLPASQAGHITFGCLNNFGKVNETVLRAWVAVLQAVEGSRLLLHCPAGAAQARVRQWFESRGLATHRLDLVPWTATRVEYLQLFQHIDIGLSPFPYNGGTTTCDALWMGVPVVSLASRTAVSRLALSVLSNAGFPEWAAHSEDEYVQIASQLAHDPPRLAELRATLRPRMRASPLMDAPRFAHNVETAYRTMWRQWCELV